MRLVFRLAVVTLILVLFVQLVGAGRVTSAIGWTVHAVESAPGRWDSFRDRWDRAERKAQRQDREDRR